VVPKAEDAVLEIGTGLGAAHAVASSDGTVSFIIMLVKSWDMISGLRPI
jgi:protein-L-isoaspartate O-methyltransferase